MRITFWAAVSSPAAGSIAASGVTFSSATVPAASVGSGSAAALFSGGAGFGEAGGVSRDARILEIGGKTARFGFVSPSWVFLLGFFRSISETLSASRTGCRGVSGADFAAEGVAVLPADATSSFIFCFGSFVLAEVAGLRAVALPRAAGLRVAVLLLVFVAIVVRLKFCSWLELP
jgi:hypothetical protein